MSNDKKKPAYKTSHGPVSAAVWPNEAKNEETGEARVFHSVSFERTYKEGDSYKTSSSFGIGSDLANLERCIFDLKVWDARQRQK